MKVARHSALFFTIVEEIATEGIKGQNVLGGFLLCRKPVPKEVLT